MTFSSESDVAKTEQGMKARTGRHLSTIKEHQQHLLDKQTRHQRAKRSKNIKAVS